ncbi:MAG: CcoQ/FixQ family Cbb3-type cytochrome c oxidase assembly chaperone [Zetaproteobacteria bacterium CG_4_9_14_3_um_filter_49_83]|nr:MAG: cytochrome C oxidase Cbb3 [Zetaproteobacteria bacterium CG1_02_49_23]PIQ33650.1 MAG: CcoQ/FixQ family Cbb3-type cytochrome c oxidase assembly chaperone [Zetaproteobacteria bacterium CG17_big_fil_post_rev_8_21_14_2_50_50_13]PIV29559.1 MAG: CcoQ/FixQ family Cbb3-type cytochrome c oxidase assembly chaperone [Zetaproteobacteria bacterium CG02_land_8_20_14_3_00_50_9]PIY54557.1 MAG: CcoQ/FixQ family Cbb3-type cytochrome c oxidase assembly chaperone [Zetaproteobacteria bacterium CG_4_10_14_0_8_
MTRADWTGLAIVLVLTVLMIALYAWVFRPSNKQKFEQYRDFVNDEQEEERREVEHGQTR